MLEQRREIGRRIRTLRTARGYSQERLAEHAQLDRHTIYRTELGTHSASLDVLLLIARGLDVPLWRLFHDE